MRKKEWHLPWQVASLLFKEGWVDARCFFTLAWVTKINTATSFQSLAEVRERLERDEYSQAGVFDPSRTRIFPFLRSLNEQSIAVGNEAVGDLHPVSSRRPKGESTVKSSLRSRKEIYVKDPRGSGLSLNSGDRKSAQNTLGHLRSTQKKIVPQPTTVTLDNLRKNPSMPPNLEG